MKKLQANTSGHKIMIDVESDTYMHPSTFKIIGRRIKE